MIPETCRAWSPAVGDVEDVVGRPGLGLELGVEVLADEHPAQQRLVEQVELDATQHQDRSSVEGGSQHPSGLVVERAGRVETHHLGPDRSRCIADLECAHARPPTPVS
jgi:hypothetical protein